MCMAERIKERRKTLGYTQEELASKVGLQKSAIAKYEKGRVENIKRSMIAKMSSALECSPSYLMGWEETTTSSAVATLTPDAAALLTDYNKLNDLGKEKARDDVADLTEIPKYTEKRNASRQVGA